MGGLLPYKWEAYCWVSLSSRLRSQEGPAIQMGGVLPYKLEVYCRTFFETSRVGVSETLLCLLSRNILWILFSCLPGNLALKNGGDFWWILSGLRFSPRNEARKILKKFGENSEQNSGQNSGQKFEKLSFCDFSKLMKLSNPRKQGQEDRGRASWLQRPKAWRRVQSES